MAIPLSDQDPLGPSRPVGPREVADMLDTLAAADREVAAIVDELCGSRSPISRATVTSLERLLAMLRPAADLRARLAGVDGSMLAAGIRLHRRRREHQHDGPPDRAHAVTTTAEGDPS